MSLRKEFETRLLIVVLACSYKRLVFYGNALSRDGLMFLPDCFTANDISAVIDCLWCGVWDCTIWVFTVFSILFHYFCT